MCNKKYFVRRYNACCNCDNIHNYLCEYCNKTAFIDSKKITRYIKTPAETLTLSLPATIKCTNCNDKGYIHGGFPNQKVKSDYKDNIQQSTFTQNTRILLDKAHYQGELRKQLQTIQQTLKQLIDEYLNKEKIIKYLKEDYNNCNYFNEICFYYFGKIFRFEKKKVFCYDEIINGQYHTVERLKGLEISYMYNKIEYKNTMWILYNYMKVMEFNYLIRFFKQNMSNYKPELDNIEVADMYNLAVEYINSNTIKIGTTELILTTFEELVDIRNNIWNSSCINRFFRKIKQPSWHHSISEKDILRKKKWCQDMNYLDKYWSLINSEPEIPEFYRRFHPDVQKLHILCELFENIEKVDNPIINGINYKYLPIEIIEQIFKYNIFYV